MPSTIATPLGRPPGATSTGQGKVMARDLGARGASEGRGHVSEREWSPPLAVTHTQTTDSSTTQRERDMKALTASPEYGVGPEEVVQRWDCRHPRLRRQLAARRLQALPRLRQPLLLQPAWNGVFNNLALQQVVTGEGHGGRAITPTQAASQGGVMQRRALQHLQLSLAGVQGGAKGGGQQREPGRQLRVPLPQPVCSRAACRLVPGGMGSRRAQSASAGSMREDPSKPPTSPPGGAA